MSKPGDKSSQAPPSKEPTANTADKLSGVPRDSHDRASEVARSSGRAAYDERGNSVWEWQLETGVYSRDISTQRLKKLDLNDLSIAETATHRRPPGLDDPQAKPGGGFNPYDNSKTGGGKVGANPYNSAGSGALKPGAKPAAPTRKPADMKKLQEWMELRKRVEQLKREEDQDD